MSVRSTCMALYACAARWKDKGINYRMHPGNVPALSEAKVDVCVLANNHVLDWGYQGLKETLNTLQVAAVTATKTALLIAASPHGPAPRLIIWCRWRCVGSGDQHFGSWREPWRGAALSHCLIAFLTATSACGLIRAPLNTHSTEPPPPPISPPLPPVDDE